MHKRVVSLASLFISILHAERDNTFGFKRRLKNRVSMDKGSCSPHSRGKEMLARAAHLMKLVFRTSPAEDQVPGFLHNVKVIVCSLARRLQRAGDDDLVRMMLAFSCWRLSSRRTRRLHGVKMRVTGRIQIPNSRSVSIVG